MTQKQVGVVLNDERRAEAVADGHGLALRVEISLQIARPRPNDRARVVQDRAGQRFGIISAHVEHPSGRNGQNAVRHESARPAHRPSHTHLPGSERAPHLRIVHGEDGTAAQIQRRTVGHGQCSPDLNERVRAKREPPAWHRCQVVEVGLETIGQEAVVISIQARLCQRGIDEHQRPPDAILPTVAAGHGRAGEIRVLRTVLVINRDPTTSTAPASPPRVIPSIRPKGPAPAQPGGSYPDRAAGAGSTMAGGPPSVGGDYPLKIEGAGDGQPDGPATVPTPTAGAGAAAGTQIHRSQHRAVHRSARTGPVIAVTTVAAIAAAATAIPPIGSAATRADAAATVDPHVPLTVSRNDRAGFHHYVRSVDRHALTNPLVAYRSGVVDRLAENRRIANHAQVPIGRQHRTAAQGERSAVRHHNRPVLKCTARSIGFIWSVALQPLCGHGGIDKHH